LGDDEVSRGELSIKSLRSEQGQQTLSQEQTIAFLQEVYIYEGRVSAA